MENVARFKYQRLLDDLLSKGCRMPTLFPPNDMMACRFVFSEEVSRNHLPQYISNPKRMLQDIRHGNASTSLLALSCFDTCLKAEGFYANLRKAFKNVALTIGDSLSEGKLTNKDGRRTEVGDNGHFDFYEFEECNLGNTFRITKNLIER
jgi:hypothetical protein